VLTEGDVLIRSLADQAYRSLAEQYGSMPLQSGCVSITDGDHLTPTFAESGVAFIFVGNVSSGHLHFENCKYVDPAYFAALSPLRKPKQGDVLYSAVGATLGVPAIVDSDRQFCFQRHVAILRPDQSRLRSKFLWHMLRSSTVFKTAWSATTGTAQPTIPLRAIRALQIPCPPLEVQNNCVSRLERLNAMSLDGQHERKKMGAELKALLPSILDRAFRGEL
jgi:type I restriction enzyme S subunit